MATDANLLLVSSGVWPERIVLRLEEQGAFVEVIRPEELEMSFQVVGPDLVVHYGLAGAKAVLGYLGREPEGRPIRLVLVGPRAELSALRKLDRRVVLGVLADDLPETTICERIVSLASRKHEARVAAPIASAKTPSVPPVVSDPLLERRASLGTSGAEISPSAPPSPAEESILTWFQSSPPPRISEKPDGFEAESAAEDELPGADAPDENSAAEDELPGAEAPDENSALVEAASEELPSFEEEADLELPTLRPEPPEGPMLSASSEFPEAPAPSAEEKNPDADLEDRETLLMDADPSELAPADSVSDRETLHLPMDGSGEEASLPAAPAGASKEDGLLTPEASAVSSVSSMVASVGDRGAPSREPERSAPRGRAPTRTGWVFGALALAALSAVFFLYPRSREAPRAPAAPLAEPAPSVEAAADLAPNESAPDEPRTAPVNLWARDPEPGVRSCSELLGDVSLLRFGDVDQSALFWKKARGKLMLGDREGALAELCRAAHIFPTGLAVEALVELLLDMGAAPLAEPFMDQAKKARPHRPKTLELYGDLKSQLGESAEARAIWLEALGTAGASDKVLRQIARQLVAQAEAVLAGGQVGLGERLLRRAATLDPSNLAALTGLARVADDRGDHERARRFRELGEMSRTGPRTGP